MISVSCNIKNRQTILVWKDGLKELGQRNLEKVLEGIRKEGYEVSKTIDEYFEFLKENMSFVITKVSSERADELMEELELL